MTDLKQPDPRLVDVATVLGRHRYDHTMPTEALARAVLETADLPRETPTLKGGRRKAGHVATVTLPGTPDPEKTYVIWPEDEAKKE